MSVYLMSCTKLICPLDDDVITAYVITFDNVFEYIPIIRHVWLNEIVDILMLHVDVYCICQFKQVKLESHTNQG